MRIVAVIGQKGGTGKTTAAICLAAEIVTRGRRVLLVDADPQGSARTWGAVAAEQGRPAPVVVAMGPGLHRPDQLPRLAGAFDMAVLDTPPRSGEVMRAALAVADLALLPCGPSALDAWAMAESLALLEEARRFREFAAAVLVTRRNPRTRIGAGARTVLAKSGLPVLAAELAHRTVYQEALAAGSTPTLFSPSSPAAVEIRALCDELDTPSLEVARVA